MNRKENYKDLEKYKNTCKNQKRRYFAKSQHAKNERMPWSVNELDLIFTSRETDAQLARKLGRSVNAIQVKRSRTSHIDTLAQKELEREEMKIQMQSDAYDRMVR